MNHTATTNGFVYANNNVVPSTTTKLSSSSSTTNMSTNISSSPSTAASGIVSVSVEQQTQTDMIDPYPLNTSCLQQQQEMINIPNCNNTDPSSMPSQSTISSSSQINSDVIHTHNVQQQQQSDSPLMPNNNNLNGIMITAAAGATSGHNHHNHHHHSNHNQVSVGMLFGIIDSLFYHHHIY